MQTTERIEGDDLPYGGAYAIVYYQDIDGAPTTKDKALKAEIFEYTAQDKPIAITMLDLTGAADDSNSTGD
jgi:hypothetical protein